MGDAIDQKQDAFAQLNHLAQFHIRDITRPLTLTEQESLANKLVQQIVQEERAKRVQLQLPKHLDEVRKMVDPAGKVQSKLPVFSQLSPRTRRKLAALPKPNEYEQQQVRALERQSKEVGGKAIYDHIHNPRQFVELEREVLHKDASDMVNPQLIPNVIDKRNVTKLTTKYYEDAEKYKRRKDDQNKQLERLFGEHKPVHGHESVTEDTIGMSPSSKPSTAANHHQLSSRTLSSSGLGQLHRISSSSGKRTISPSSSEKAMPSPINDATTKVTGLHSVTDVASALLKASSSMAVSIASNERKASATSSSTLSKGHRTKANEKLMSSTMPVKLLPPLQSATPPVMSPFGSPKPYHSTSLHQLSAGEYSPLRPVTSSSALYLADPKADDIRVPTAATGQLLQQQQQLKEREYLNEFSAKVKDEMGIDLNAKYNRLRKFRQCLQVLLLHMMHCRQRAAFLKWWDVTLMLRKRVMRNAASRIYRALHSGILWRKQQEQARYEALQQADQERREKANRAFVFRNASTITRSIRRYVKRKRLWRLIKLRRAATHIQRIYRGWCGRRRFERLWQAYLRRKLAVIRIQCLVRMRLAHRRVVLLRKMSFVDHWLQTLAAKTETYRHLFLEQGAASYIARAYRNHLIVRRLHRLVYWNHIAKSVVIQRVYRGYRVRKVFRKRLTLYRAHLQRQEEASIVIQRYIRRWLAELYADGLHSERQAAKDARYQDKLWRLAKGVSLGKKLKVIRRKLWLRTRIYKMWYLHQQAILIQRIWRGHHGRVRMWFVRVHHRLAYWARIHQRRMHAALLIQTRYRGYLTRRRHRQRLLLNNVVRVQCAFRMYRARSRTRHLKFIHTQARKLTQMFRRLVHKHRFHLKFMRQQLLAEKIVVIQALMRRALAVRKVDRLRTKQRRTQELSMSARCHIVHLLAGIQCRLLHDTITKPITQRYYAVSRQECLCLGPLQAIFVLGFCHGNRLRTEPKLLPTHRVDSASFVKFCMRIEGLVQMTKLQMQALGFGVGKHALASRPANGVYHDHADDDTTHHAFRQQAYASPQALTQPLLVLLTTGDIPLPTMHTTLSTTDIDLAFKKAKAEDNVTHKLGYAEFAAALAMLGRLHYSERDVGKGAANLKGAAARGGVPLSGTIDTPALNANDEGDDAADAEPDGANAEATDNNDSAIATAAGAAGDDVNAAAVTANDRAAGEGESPTEADTSALPSVGTNLQSLLAEQIRHVHHGTLTSSFLTRETLTLHPHTILSEDAIRNNTVDYRFALVLRLLYVFQQESYVQEALQWLATEALARLGLFVIRMQCLVRRRLARRRIHCVRLQRAEEHRQAVIAAKAAHVQALARAFLYRRRVMKLAQGIIIKYQPYLAEPYYYNPRTQVKTYTKPKILGHLDAFTIALPEEGLDYMVYCYNCSTQRASCFCQECEDSMCRLCYDSLHCKGARRSHHAQSIPLCAYCHGQQMATKSCVTCVIRPAKANTYRATIRPVHRRAYYCDTCFVHEHDAHFYRQLEQIPSKRAAYQTLVQHSKQATLVVNTLLQQRIRTSHTYTHLIQPCEECNQWASAWRCFDCEQVYCGRCLVVFHQLNPTFVTHAIEPLPYYTPDMHRSYHADVARKRFTYKWERLLLQERRRAQQIAYDAAVTLQAWYRMHYYSRIGLKIMQRRRSKWRSMYRLRQRENDLVRRQRWYQLQDFFGSAPMLISDTREEKVLKRMWLWQRESARRYILQNVDDWGFYRLRNRTNAMGSGDGNGNGNGNGGGKNNSPSSRNESRRGSVNSGRNGSKGNTSKPSSPSSPPSSPSKGKGQSQSQSQALVPALIQHVHATRKGTPKRGFDVGEIDELIEQALLGGYRLPGRITVRENDQYAYTTYNLMPYLRRGELVRIQHRYFGVIVVEENRVKLSRKWYPPRRRQRFGVDGSGGDGGDGDDGEGDEAAAAMEELAEKLARAKERAKKKNKNRQEDNDDGNNDGSTSKNSGKSGGGGKKGTSTSGASSRTGSDADGTGSIISLDQQHAKEWSGICYRVPTYRDENGQWYYRTQYAAYEWTINNPLYQVYLTVARMYAQRMIRLSLHFYHANQASRNPQEAEEWKHAAVGYAQRVRRVTAQMATGDAFVDLSRLTSPYLHGEEEDPVNNPALKPLYLEDQDAWVALQAPDRKRRSTQTSQKPGDRSGDDEDSDEDSDEDDDDESGSEDPLHPGVRKKPKAGGGGGGTSGGKVVVGADESPTTKSRRPRVRNMANASSTKDSEANGEGEDEDEDDEEGGAGGRSQVKITKRKAGDHSDDDDDDGDDDSDGGDHDEDDGGDLPDARIDYDSAYIDPETGQKTLSAAAIKRQEREERMARKSKKKNGSSRKSKKSSKKINKPKKAWFANKEQEEERKAREDKMSVVELAMEAGEWKEEIDVLTENIYFININTNEMMTTVPRAVQAKRQLEFENSRKKRDFDVAQRRIQRLEMETRNRLLITGGRKK